MNGSTHIPPVSYLKYKAKLLRKEQEEIGCAMSHSSALERIAHSYGHRDWNSLVAVAANSKHLVMSGQRVKGTYLGQKFTGVVKAIDELVGGEEKFKVTIIFDEPVDVVTFDSFSNLRKQVSCVLSSHAATLEKTSDGAPHMRLDL